MTAWHSLICTVQCITIVITNIVATTSCPSGLRSHVKAVVLIGAGSNPADVICFLSSRAVGAGERDTCKERPC